MKLVLYSGGYEEQNNDIHKYLLHMSAKKNPQITYIPSCSYHADVDFRDYVRYFTKYKLTKFIYFPIDAPCDNVLKKEVFKSDIIHLAGGNTFYFLRHLRRSKLLNEFKAFVKRGGILTGLSAGAILMTPTVDTAAFPDFDRDDNDENIKNFKAMNLVNFSFFPHYKNSKRYDKELALFSKKIKNPLYACSDGSGIIVRDRDLKFVGKVYAFINGEKAALSLRSR